MADEKEDETAVSGILRDSTPDVAHEWATKIESDPCSDAGRLTSSQSASRK